VKDPASTPRFQQLYEPLAASTQRTWGKNKQRAVVDKTGRRTRSSSTNEETPGTPLGDVWEIGIVAPVAHERTGYPTQKPEALLERLLLACTSEDDLVLDPYAGSGTTLAVARRLGRRAVGIDAGTDALEVARSRLLEMGRAPTEQRIALGRPLKKSPEQRPGGRQVA
jgi:site-specific DNA-methyltransferase (adenine-specific)